LKTPTKLVAGLSFATTLSTSSYATGTSGGGGIGPWLNGGGNGSALSHHATFIASTSVPDGGLTILLLGAALSLLALLARLLRK
jgi:hypothetical protein